MDPIPCPSGKEYYRQVDTGKDVSHWGSVWKQNAENRINELVEAENHFSEDTKNWLLCCTVDYHESLKELRNNLGNALAKKCYDFNKGRLYVIPKSDEVQHYRKLLGEVRKHLTDYRRNIQPRDLKNWYTFHDTLRQGLMGYWMGKKRGLWADDTVGERMGWRTRYMFPGMENEDVEKQEDSMICKNLCLFSLFEELQVSFPHSFYACRCQKEVTNHL